MAAAELTVAILWHMHQPDYVDAVTGRAAMPWVRLHALLSYHDMVRILREVPEARATFNLTPILPDPGAASAG
jgi:alpha-amylase/alpha-mannosidase (GH57 family)